MKTTIIAAAAAALLRAASCGDETPPEGTPAEQEAQAARAECETRCAGSYDGCVDDCIEFPEVDAGPVGSSDPNDPHDPYEQ